MDNMFQSLFGRTFRSMTELWLGVAYVVCMFAVITFRPQRIGDRNLFRLSYLLFGLYLVLPAIADGIVSLATAGLDTGTAAVRQPFAAPAWGTTAVNVLVGILASCLLAASICLGLGSLTSRGSDQPGAPVEQ